MPRALTKTVICVLSLGAAWVCLCLATFVPALGAPSLGIWRVPEPSVPMHAMADVSISVQQPSALPESDVDAEAARDIGQVRLPDVEGACEHVPFLLRPLAARPETARLVFLNRDGTERAEVKVDCATGRMIDGSARVL